MLISLTDVLECYYSRRLWHGSFYTNRWPIWVKQLTFAWIIFHLCDLHQPIYSIPSCLCQVMSRRLMKNVLIHYWNHGSIWGLKLTTRTFTPISWGYHQWRRSSDGCCIKWVLPEAAEIAVRVGHPILVSFRSPRGAECVKTWRLLIDSIVKVTYW